METPETALAWHSTLPHELYTAMGRVAHSTALLDAMLVEFAEYLADSGVIWRLVSGQSTDWLIQTCRVLLEEADPYSQHYPPEFHDEIQRMFDKAGELRVLRNRVIHGTWSRVAFHEEPLSRPWGEAPSGRVYWVARDRQRRAFEEQAMTVADVERLANEIDRLTAGIIRAWRNVTPHEPDWPPFRRWHDLGFNEDA